MFRWETDTCSNSYAILIEIISKENSKSISERRMTITSTGVYQFHILSRNNGVYTFVQFLYFFAHMRSQRSAACHLSSDWTVFSWPPNANDRMKRRIPASSSLIRQCRITYVTEKHLDLLGAHECLNAFANMTLHWKFLNACNSLLRAHFQASFRVTTYMIFCFSVF